VFNFGEETMRALQRGVEFRLILEKPNNAESMLKEVSEFQETGAFRIRYILDPLPAIISIYDKV
jgi:hypothetical protein